MTTQANSKIVVISEKYSMMETEREREDSSEEVISVNWHFNNRR